MFRCVTPVCICAVLLLGACSPTPLTPQKVTTTTEKANVLLPSGVTEPIFEAENQLTIDNGLNGTDLTNGIGSSLEENLGPLPGSGRVKTAPSEVEIEGPMLAQAFKALDQETPFRIKAPTAAEICADCHHPEPLPLESTCLSFEASELCLGSTNTMLSETIDDLTETQQASLFRLSRENNTSALMAFAPLQIGYRLQTAEMDPDFLQNSLNLNDTMTRNEVHQIILENRSEEALYQDSPLQDMLDIELPEELEPIQVRYYPEHHLGLLLGWKEATKTYQILGLMILEASANPEQ